MGGRHGLIHNEKVTSYKLTQTGLDLLKRRLTSRRPLESHRGQKYSSPSKRIKEYDAISL